MPRVSAQRIKLWSYPDLMALRTIYWLRQSKTFGDGHSVPATSMHAVRRALTALHEVDLELWTEESGPRVSVDHAGRVFITADGVRGADGQSVLDGDLLDLIAPFETEQGRAPDLYAPRPSLRIIPGKLSGSPHIVRTRIETIAIAALGQRGLSEEKIAALYPIVPPDAIAEALDLEEELRRNLRAAA